MQANALKKYRSGIEPFHKTCDNEHTLAALGQAEKLSVRNTPRRFSVGSINHTRTWPPSAFEWRTEGGICSDNSSQETSEGIVVGCLDAGDVFPEEAGEGSSASKSVCKVKKLQCEVAAVIVERLAGTGYREGLAGCPGDHELRKRDAEPAKMADADRGEVAP